MPNKREFKKYVDAIGSSVCQEMATAYYNVEGADREAISKAVEQVLNAACAAKSNANVFFDKGVKAFENAGEYSKAKKNFFKALFNKINSDFAAAINAAVKTFNAALPASVKEQNKQALAD